MSAGKCRLHLTARVSTYRRWARELVKPGDTVIELGASTGKTTVVLACRAARVLAVEHSPSLAADTRERLAAYPHVTIITGDAFEAGPVLALIKRADAVFIDIGGSAGPWQTMDLAHRYLHLFRPRVLVLRNTKLNSFVASLDSYEPDATGHYWAAKN